MILWGAGDNTWFYWAAAPIGGLVCADCLCLSGRFGFGGVGADVCNPVVDECEEAVEAIGGQLAERDFRSQTGQVRLAVQPRDTQGVQARGQPVTVVLAVIRGRAAHSLDADFQGGLSAVRAGVQGQHPAPAEPAVRAESPSTVNEG